jgi:fumarate hydratase subunit alpha
LSPATHRNNGRGERLCSENRAPCAVLPSDGAETIEDYIVGVMAGAGSNPCPPVVVGVGLGGTIEQAALLAKRALLRDARAANADPFYADMEKRVLDKINRLGIGPQGFGGRVTPSKVNIVTYPTTTRPALRRQQLICHATRMQARLLNALYSYNIISRRGFSRAELVYN